MFQDVNEAMKVQGKRRGGPFKASFSARPSKISQGGPRPGTSRTRMDEVSDHEYIPQAQLTPKPTNQKSMSSRKIQRTRELFSTVEQYSNAGMNEICDEGYRFIDINVLSVLPMCYQIVTSAEYQKWKAEHSNCKADFKGSAPAIEPEGADRIFKRSVKKHGLHCTTAFGDGDSKSFQCVQDTYKDIGKKLKSMNVLAMFKKELVQL